MEKQNISVVVAGRAYNLVSSDPPEHVLRVADYVDRQIRETAIAARQPQNTATVLVALNLGDELIKARDEITRLRRELRAAREAQN